MILAQIIYIIGLIPLAYYNAWRIKRDLRIYHGLNGIYHFPAFALAAYLTQWEVVFAMLFCGKLFFDIALYKFRGLHFAYMPLSPKSIMDRIEKWIFCNDGYFAKFTYLTIIVSLNVYYANR